MNNWGAMVDHLATLPGEAPPQGSHCNPCPAGVIRQGSASELALQVLRAAHGQSLTHAQIKQRTGCTQKALSWALIYLFSQTLIERAPDLSRNGRNSRYWAVLTGAR